MRKFNHVGIVTTEDKPGAVFNDGLKVWLTDFTKSPNKVEFMKFEKGSCMPAIIQESTHMAYEVPSLEKALKGAKVLFGPAVCSDTLTIAFVEEEGIPVELMEFKQ